jgi:RNA polymerase sigma-70 factor (ECF subfamily)
MNASESDIDSLLDRARGGDDSARQQLLGCYRARLRKMIGFHLDRRLAARVDPSDVVQEALMDADRKLDDYLRQRPLPFYPWLRRLALERVIKLHQRHLRTAKRSVRREEPGVLNLPEDSALELAARLLDVQSGPSARLVREELRARVRSALDRLSETDREVLVLRHLEELPHREIATVLGITEAAVKTRHVRALERLGELLGQEVEEDER